MIRQTAYHAAKKLHIVTRRHLVRKTCKKALSAHNISMGNAAVLRALLHLQADGKRPVDISCPFAVITAVRNVRLGKGAAAGG